MKRLKAVEVADQTENSADKPIKKVTLGRGHAERENNCTWDEKLLKLFSDLSSIKTKFLLPLWKHIRNKSKFREYGQKQSNEEISGNINSVNPAYGQERNLYSITCRKTMQNRNSLLQLVLVNNLLKKFSGNYECIEIPENFGGHLLLLDSDDVLSGSDFE